MGCNWNRWGVYPTHSLTKVPHTHVCSYDICHLWTTPPPTPPNPTLNSKAEAFGLIGQLLDVKSRIVDPPIGGIRGLLNHLWH